MIHIGSNGILWVALYVVSIVNKRVRERDRLLFFVMLLLSLRYEGSRAEYSTMGRTRRHSNVVVEKMNYGIS